MKSKNDQIIKTALYSIAFEDAILFDSFPEVPFEQSDKYKEKMNILIEKTKKKETSLIRMNKKKILIVVAIFTLLTLTFSACALIPKIKQFFVTIFDDHVSFQIDSESSELTEIYHPTYLPEGFKKVDEIKLTKNVMKVFEKGNEGLILEQSSLGSQRVSLNMDDNQYYEILLGSLKVHYTKNMELYTLIWIHDNYLFSLTCPDSITWDEIEKIVLGIAPLKE